MERKFRLTRSTDIKRVRQLGKSYAHPLVVLIALPNDRDDSRFSIIAGRSVGGAVDRNRSKRLLRESLRPVAQEVSSGWDMVWLARRPIQSADFQQVQKAVQALLGRAHLLKLNDVGKF